MLLCISFSVGKVQGWDLDEHMHDTKYKNRSCVQTTRYNFHQLTMKSDMMTKLMDATSVSMVNTNRLHWFEVRKCEIGKHCSPLVCVYLKGKSTYVSTHYYQYVRMMSSSSSFSQRFAVQFLGNTAKEWIPHGISECSNLRMAISNVQFTHCYHLRVHFEVFSLCMSDNCAKSRIIPSKSGTTDWRAIAISGLSLPQLNSRRASSGRSGGDSDASYSGLCQSGLYFRLLNVRL